jgi:hypothetical protein
MGSDLDRDTACLVCDFRGFPQSLQESGRLIPKIIIRAASF